MSQTSAKGRKAGVSAEDGLDCCPALASIVNESGNPPVPAFGGERMGHQSGQTVTGRR